MKPHRGQSGLRIARAATRMEREGMSKDAAMAKAHELEDADRLEDDGSVKKGK